jgi:O-antigen/teichoic acid export membrane protein
MFNTLRSWSQDRLLRGVVKNSSYLFSSNAVSAALSMLQGIFAVRLLGVNGYGLVSGTIIVFVSNVNRLFSFRMNEVVVKHFGQALLEGKKDRAAAVIKGIGLVESITSIVAFLAVLLFSPWAATHLGKDSQTAPLFAFYGLILLADLVYETSLGVLQTTKRFDRVALVNLVQSILTASMILAAFVLHGKVTHIVLAYWLGKTFTGLATTALAARQLNTTLGKGWWRASLRLIPGWRGLASFAVSTNLNGTVNLIVRDSETLFIAYFLSNTEVGYFRLALSLITLVMMPIEPFIYPTYTEITHTIAQRQWAATRRLLKRVSTIAAGWTLSAGGGLALLGWWLIPLLYKPESAPAYPAVLILLLGYGFANIFQWNRPLLLALGNPVFPLAVTALVGLVKTILTLTLVPSYGYLAEAAVLSGFFIISISIILWRGLTEISKSEIGNPQ